MMTRYSTPQNTAEYCPTDSDYCYDPDPYEPTQDDMTEWSAWLTGQLSSETTQDDAMADSEREAVILSRWGYDEPPF